MWFDRLRDLLDESEGLRRKLLLQFPPQVLVDHLVEVRLNFNIKLPQQHVLLVDDSLF